MQLTKLFTFFVTLPLALANTVTFVSQDKIGRTIVFTPSVGHAEVPDAYVPGKSNVKVEIPYGWIGNWFSVSDGAPRIPGMLGEVTFQGWGDLTYFDVSAIVDPDDHNGVKELYPKTAGIKSDKMSGCDAFPCLNAYNKWNDVQTKTTTETDLVCTLGSRGGKRSVETLEVASEENVERRFVDGTVN